jgi:hypothetical protein
VCLDWENCCSIAVGFDGCDVAFVGNPSMSGLEKEKSALIPLHKN